MESCLKVLSGLHFDIEMMFFLFLDSFIMLSDSLGFFTGSSLFSETYLDWKNKMDFILIQNFQTLM